MQRPNTTLTTPRAAKPWQNGIRKFIVDATNSVTMYVKVNVTRNTSVMTPDSTRPTMFVTPMIEISVAACVVVRPTETPRSGIYVSGSD
ncbi:hypothetical protein DPMN_009939 [Dreissena polymorpha]|uniref:Uncharacterized protein n=1 Tax=Dreissena polymorpha TaxID=45954 RepID=A0A9D4N380_DREPO|nr:hypothetical protein DPMN_009939 [Dreissena polymorpha]